MRSIAARSRAIYLTTDRRSASIATCSTRTFALAPWITWLSWSWRRWKPWISGMNGRRTWLRVSRLLAANLGVTMWSVQTILHPTDFSDPAQNSFQLACALASDLKARLIVLHVVPQLVAFRDDLV